MTLPTLSDHHLIVGMNGSGKTVAAIYTWACRLHRSQRWLIVDTKRDDYIAEIEDIPGVNVLDNFNLPKGNGVFIIRPFPEADDENLEALLMQVWHRKNTGIYIDEGYMVPKNSRAMKAIYTQGRSLKVPVITLSQRPVDLNRLAVSESNFRQCFDLSDDRDKKTISEFIPGGIDKIGTLPKHHSIYYNNKEKKTVTWGAVPKPEVSFGIIEDKLKKPRKFF
jgi:hypothetical protein